MNVMGLDMTYAIIANGGKQYRVATGDLVQLEKIDSAVGEKVTFDNVLMLTDDDNLLTGTPYLPGVKVLGEIVEHGRGDKVRIIKFRRRKHYKKTMGHRQYYTTVKITDIERSKKHGT